METWKWHLATASLLPFEVVEVAYLDASEITVDINHDSDGYGSFRSRDGDGKQGKEIAFHSSREEKTVEHGEVDVRGVQH